MSVGIFNAAVPIEPGNVIVKQSGTMTLEAHGWLGNDVISPGNRYEATVPPVLRCTLAGLVIVFVRWPVTSLNGYVWAEWLGDGYRDGRWTKDYGSAAPVLPADELNPGKDSTSQNVWDAWCFPGGGAGNQNPWETLQPYFFVDFGPEHTDRLIFQALPYFYYDQFGKAGRWFFHYRFSAITVAGTILENQFKSVLGQIPMSTPIRFQGRAEYQWESRAAEFKTYDYRFPDGPFVNVYSGRTIQRENCRIAAINLYGGDDNRVSLPTDRGVIAPWHEFDMTREEPQYATVPLYVRPAQGESLEISEPPLPGNEITLEVLSRGYVPIDTAIRANIDAKYAANLETTTPPDGMIGAGEEGPAEFKLKAKADANTENERIPIQFTADNVLVEDSPIYHLTIKDADRPQIVLSTRLVSLAIPAEDELLTGNRIVRAAYRVFLSSDPLEDVAVSLSVSPITPDPGISVFPNEIILNSANYQEGVTITVATDNRDLKLNEVSVTHTSSAASANWDALTASLLVRERLSFLAPPTAAETVPTYSGRRYGRYAESSKYPPAIAGKYYVSRKVLDLVEDTMLVTAREAFWQDPPAEIEGIEGRNILDAAQLPVPGRKLITWFPVSPIESYSLRYREKKAVPDDWSIIEIASRSGFNDEGDYSPAAPSYTLDGLISGKVYEIAVRANDLILTGIGYTNRGEGPWSRPLEITIP